ncbi:hypothetical protein [Bacillus sp. JJ722]|uniref:hypothetical protein n=1 Tax=Bacillus sp. JJ722 TaxID=3122973 RepID=UPI002FFE2B1B
MISRFIFALYKTENNTRMHELVREAVIQKEELIKDIYKEECDEIWTKKDKEERIKELLQEINECKNKIEQISSGTIHLIDFEPEVTGGCYLFGCKRHNHLEYKD